MTNNVLFLSYDGMTDALGQSQVLPYLEGLSANKNVQFHLISFEKDERFEKYKKEIEVICQRSNIVWHPLSYTKKPPLLSTLYDIQRMKSLAHRLNKTENFSIVHCRSYLSAMVGLGMKKRFGAKFLFDMRGFWADERVEGRIWNLSNPVFKLVYRYFKKQENKFMEKADGIVSLTNKGKDVIETWQSWKKNKVEIDVIPCCADLTLFDPAKISSEHQKSLREELKIQETNFVLGYVGSIGTWYLLPEMLDFFKKYQVANTNSIFLFVTNENPTMILELAKNKGIDENLIRVVSSPRNKMPVYISLFDFSIFFILSSFSKQASSPVKQGEIMGMGIPIVCNSGVGDTDAIVSKYRSGIVLSNFNFESIALHNEQFDAKITRSGAKDYFDIVKGIQQYSDIYERLWKK